MEEEYLDDDDFLYGRNGEAGGAGDGAAVVGSRSGAAASGSSGLSGLEDVFADDAGVADVVENEDVALLKRLVLNERGAPEILPYNERVVDELLEIVRNQQEVVEDLREDVDEALEGNLYQMELDRINYLLASYLRTRLFKIEKNALHILMHEEIHGRLSVKEFEYCKRYVDLLEAHFNASALQSFPHKFKGLAENDEEGNMVTAPRMQKHVFCRVRAKDLGQVDFNSTPGAPAQPVALEEADIFVTRYDKIAPFVRADKISLI